MGTWRKNVRQGLRQFAACVLLGTVGLTGCGQKAAEPEAAKQADPPAQVAAAPAPAAATAQAPLPPPPDDGRHQPFDKATRRADDPPEECNRPPDATVSGKPVFKLYNEVVRLWDTIRYVTPAGKRVAYSATIETDLGNIEIELHPEWAPNHVRNFVALARAGYYDGLFFDRVRHEESEDEAATPLESIEAGCPLGTGDPGNGSIGYWLNPETPEGDPKPTHEEGTVGACRGAEPDTAACRFYITLCKAPYLDGNYTVFGKVTRGLDVARKIHVRPVIVDDEDADGSRRPEKPVIIKKVTNHTQETEAPR
jgi:cyclophilin family peptidyl-prolyl cis-trans isomerase